MNCGVAQDMVQHLTFDQLYPETSVSRVLKTMKQLYASMVCIKNNQITTENSSLADIVEIQSLSVLGALQELHRGLTQGLHIGRHQSALIQKLWNSLKILAQDEQVVRYLQKIVF